MNAVRAAAIGGDEASAQATTNACRRATLPCHARGAERSNRAITGGSVNLRLVLLLGSIAASPLHRALVEHIDRRRLRQPLEQRLRIVDGERQLEHLVDVLDGR